MKRLLALLFLLSVACATSTDVYTDDEAGAAGAEAPHIQRIAVGVGRLEQALTGTSYTKDRIKDRYGSAVSWTETPSMLQGTSTCKDYQVEFLNSGSQPLTLQYKVWRKLKDNATPTSTEGCLPYGTAIGAYIYYETIRCPVPGGSIGPCWRVDYGPDGNGGGLEATAEAQPYCDQNALYNAAWNWFKSQTGYPTCSPGQVYSKWTCEKDPLWWTVTRTLQNQTPPNNQVWYAVAANYGSNWSFTCKFAQNCTGIACKKL